jgi:zinc transporter ZupT
LGIARMIFRKAWLLQPPNKNVFSGFTCCSIIALHNLPEGMATAAPLLIAKIPKKNILIINLILSLFTPLGTLLGIWSLSLSEAMMPFVLSSLRSYALYDFKRTPSSCP